MRIKRRSFLKQSSLASAGTLLIPKFLQALHTHRGLSPLTDDKILVIIQLSGGNDGLNTVIPIQDDIYYKSRPGIAISRTDAIRLNDEAGLHPALGTFARLYESGQLAILNNVGYPNPDRSHFRSMDIWHSASPAQEYWNTGWLGRYLDAACAGCQKPTLAIEIDDMLSLAMKGETHKGIACQDTARLYNTANSPFFQALEKNHDAGHEPMADYLYKTLGETIQSADLLFKAGKSGSTVESFPNTELGKNMKTVATLIKGGLGTRVYYLNLGSFDTHINQKMQQQRLLGELNGAVEVFVKEMKGAGLFNQVLLMTFSEFGRRVAQNASGGTDHGTANNVFLISGALKQQGVLNAMPALTDLQDGDLIYKVDFRNVYATLLKKWLNADSESILKDSFPTLSFL